MIAHGVSERDGLAEGLTAAEARDIVWLLNAPELYVTLTRERRCPSDAMRRGRVTR
jgi:hypothetical protein